MKIKNLYDYYLDKDTLKAHIDILKNKHPEINVKKALRKVSLTNFYEYSERKLDTDCIDVMCYEALQQGLEDLLVELGLIEEVEDVQ